MVVTWPTLMIRSPSLAPAGTATLRVTKGKIGKPGSAAWLAPRMRTDVTFVCAGG